MKRRAKLGDVEFDVVGTESLNHGADVTTKAVEKGQDISDHIKATAPTISISGIVTGPDASPKLQKLKAMQREGQLLRYVGRTSYANMVIEDIKTNHNGDIVGGYHFNLSLVQVRIAESQLVEVKISPAPQPKKAPSGSGNNPNNIGSTSKNTNNSTPQKTVKTQVKNNTSVGKQQPKAKAATKPITTELGPRRKPVTNSAPTTNKKQLMSPNTKLDKSMDIYIKQTKMVNDLKFTNKYLKK